MQLATIVNQEKGLLGEDKTPTRDRYLITIPVKEEIYIDLQEMWEHLISDHNAEEATSLAMRLKLFNLAHWIRSHPEDYEFGIWTGQFRLDEWYGNKNVIYRRFRGAGPGPLTNVPRVCVQHSPGGHEWGYNGSGPSDFALDILNHFLPPRRNPIKCWAGKSSLEAWELHQKFKQEIIAKLDNDGGMLPALTISAWIKRNLPPAKVENAGEKNG